MKKWLSVLLVMCLCCSMLVGCGGKEESEAEKNGISDGRYGGGQCIRGI